MKLESPVRLLRWCFQRGAQFITCALELQGGHDEGIYAVVTTPEWDPLAGLNERFVGLATAVQRHAAIARNLREEGWRLAAYTA